MNSLAEDVGENLATDEFNNYVTEHIGQKDPYNLKIPQGLSKHDADVLRRCRRRAHQLDHNAVLCYCCPCFFGLNTAICTHPNSPSPLLRTWFADYRSHSCYRADLGEYVERAGREHSGGSRYPGDAASTNDCQHRI